MYLVFAGNTYYPAGGWDDFQGAFYTLTDARAHALSLGYDWWHVVLDGEIVDGKR